MSFSVHTPRFARRVRGSTGEPRLPDEALAELERAAQLCDELAAEGWELRFHLPPGARHVVATLADRAGRPVRDVLLADVVELRVDR